MPAPTAIEAAQSFGAAAGASGGVFEVDHPLVRWNLTRLRDKSTSPTEFRQLARCLTSLLAYEATKDLRTVPTVVETPVATAEGRSLIQRVGLAPILRAGLGMVDAMLELMPTAEVWHLGVYRDETTAQPVQYYSKLPKHRPVDVAFILDPMLATGGSATAGIKTLRDWGVPEVKILSLIAADTGVKRVMTEYPETQIYVCEIDPLLDEHKFIVPGLGDAGDRMFRTTHEKM